VGETTLEVKMSFLRNPGQIFAFVLIANGLRLFVRYGR
jgi:hypothetical protein